MVRPVLLSLRCDGGTPGCTVREIDASLSRASALARHRIRRLQKVKCNIKYRYFWY